MSQSIADELEDKLNRRIADLTQSNDLGRALSYICRDIVDAVRQLENIRGGVPQRLDSIIQRRQVDTVNVTDSLVDLFDDLAVEIANQAHELPQLDLAALPKFWINKAENAQATIPHGLRDLDIYSDDTRIYDTLLIANGDNALTGPVSVYLGRRHVGRIPNYASAIVRNEAMDLGSNWVTIPCVVVCKDNVWMIVVDGLN